MTSLNYIEGIFFFCIISPVWVFCWHICSCTTCLVIDWRGYPIQNWCYRRLWATFWVKGTEPESSAKSGIALTPWAISTTIMCILSKKKITTVFLGWFWKKLHRSNDTGVGLPPRLDITTLVRLGPSLLWKLLYFLPPQEILLLVFWSLQHKLISEWKQASLERAENRSENWNSDSRQW